MVHMSPKRLRSKLMDRFRSSSSRESSSPPTTPRTPIPIFHAKLADATIKSRLSDSKLPLSSEELTRTPSQLKSDDAQLYRFWCPAVVVRTLDYLNQHGLQEEGLYRVPGSSETIKRLKNDFDCLGDLALEAVPNNEFNHPLQIADVASLFKQFLRDLPTPIIPKEVVTDLEQNLHDLEASRTILTTRMEPYEFYLLSMLCNHLIAVNAYADTNKMDTHNLSIVFCSSSNLGIGSNVFAALLKEEVWTGLRSAREGDALGQERIVIAGPEITSTDQIVV